MDISLERAAPGQPLNAKVLRESYLLALICAIDMILTIVLVRSGRVIEANPILVPFMERGIAAFLVVKSLMCVVPLFVLELLRSKQPLFVKKMLRVGIAVYLISYCVGEITLIHSHCGARTQIASRAVIQ